jgi:hypothetical protein
MMSGRNPKLFTDVTHTIKNIAPKTPRLRRTRKGGQGRHEKNEEIKKLIHSWCLSDFVARIQSLRKVSYLAVD